MDDLTGSAARGEGDLPLASSTVEEMERAVDMMERTVLMLIGLGGAGERLSVALSDLAKASARVASELRRHRETKIGGAA